MRTCRIMDFAVPADHRVKLKVNEKKDMYLYFAEELEKLGNIKVMMISIVIGALVTVTERSLQGQEDEWRPSKLQHY